MRLDHYNLPTVNAIKVLFQHWSLALASCQYYNVRYPTGFKPVIIITLGRSIEFIGTEVIYNVIKILCVWIIITSQQLTLSKSYFNQWLFNNHSGVNIKHFELLALWRWNLYTGPAVHVISMTHALTLAAHSQCDAFNICPLYSTFFPPQVAKITYLLCTLPTKKKQNYLHNKMITATAKPGTIQPAREKFTVRAHILRIETHINAPASFLTPTMVCLLYL